MEITHNQISALLSNIVTKDRLNAFSFSLDELNKGVFLQGTSFQDLVNNAFDSSMAAPFTNLANECGLNVRGKGDVTEFISLIKRELSEVMPLKITLAFDPDMAFLSRLHLWVSANISSKSVLDITVDPKIIGGIILVHGGKYLDLSLEKELNRVFKEISI